VDLEGILTAVSDDDSTITIDADDKKKKTKESHSILISDIKFAQVQIVF